MPLGEEGPIMTAGGEKKMNLLAKLVAGIRRRSQVAWGLALASMGSIALAGGQGGNQDPATTLRNAACNFAQNLGQTAIVFPILVIVVLWAGYMIYMGKREATDVIIKAIVATAVVLGARVIAGWVAQGTCQ